MTKPRWMTDKHDWPTCAACGRTKWRYNVAPAKQATTYRGTPVRKGALVCLDHQTVLDPGLREKLRALRAGA